jgi:hypothetical protein
VASRDGCCDHPVDRGPHPRRHDPGRGRGAASLAPFHATPVAAWMPQCRAPRSAQAYTYSVRIKRLGRVLLTAAFAAGIVVAMLAPGWLPVREAF